MESNTDHSTLSETDDQKDIRLHKDVAAFSYIWVMSIVVYFARKDSKFARFHSKQALVLTLASLVWLVPLIGHFLMIFVVVGMVLGFIHAAQGQYADVPLAGPLSRGEMDVHAVANEILKAFQAFVSFCKSILAHGKKKPETPAHHVDNPPPPQVP
jgi:uncharacterized membrane protein